MTKSHAEKTNLDALSYLYPGFNPSQKSRGSPGSPLCYSTGGIPRRFQKLHPRDVIKKANVFPERRPENYIQSVCVWSLLEMCQSAVVHHTAVRPSNLSLEAHTEDLELDFLSGRFKMSVLLWIAYNAHLLSRQRKTRPRASANDNGPKRVWTLVRSWPSWTDKTKVFSQDQDWTDM